MLAVFHPVSLRKAKATHIETINFHPSPSTLTESLISKANPTVICTSRSFTPPNRQLPLTLCTPSSNPVPGQAPLAPFPPESIQAPSFRPAKRKSSDKNWTLAVARDKPPAHHWTLTRGVEGFGRRRGPTAGMHDLLVWWIRTFWRGVGTRAWRKLVFTGRAGEGGAVGRGDWAEGMGCMRGAEGVGLRWDGVEKKHSMRGGKGFHVVRLDGGSTKVHGRL
ncbi:hypothetical protein QBC39DRAFT_44556 [Podospora conica]|nr:hypothetical protein QBC39DRAFT_44556 [Schizothecium conicum]